MSIAITLDRQAWVDQDAGPAERDFFLSGTVSCTRSEPVDLFVSMEQDGHDVDVGPDGNIPCGPDVTDWTVGFTTGGPTPKVTTGSARVRLQAGTNPNREIDEDSVTIERVVDVSPK